MDAKKVAVIGSGSWGTALAHTLATIGHSVMLYARRPELVEAVNERHVHDRFLAGSVLSRNVAASLDLQECLRGADAVVAATPSSYMRAAAHSLAGLPGDVPIVVCTKGVEAETGLLPLQVFESEVGAPERLAVLSGPNHAEEVVRCEPSGTVVAASRLQTAEFFQDLFASESFRVYASDDPVGVEICAAAKNVMAIAIGLAAGLGYGDNTQAMLMTRGLAEMSRLVEAMGGKPITCMGLAGMGDLVVTCTSRHSRNRRLGELLSQGKTLDDFTRETNMVAEGAYACKTLQPLADAHGVNLPLVSVVRSVLWEGADVADMARSLIERPPTKEFYGISH